MTLYVTIFAVLWVALLVSTAKGRVWQPLEFGALAIFVLLAGQRFETGNDWVVYRDHFLAIQQFGFEAGSSDQFPAFEPLYARLVWIAGSLVDFQEFLLLVALFNGIVLFRFARAWGVSFLGIFAIYYAWLYLATQMATTRYSLAISFILLAVIAVLKGRRLTAYALLGVASGLHVFSLAMFPLFAFFQRRLNVRGAVALLALGSVGIYAVVMAVKADLLSWMPFSEKIILYLNVATIERLSPGSAAYIVLNLVFFFWFIRGHGDDDRSRIVTWSVFYLLFFQIALWVLPVFWNRIQIFVLIIQASVFSEYFVERQRVIAMLGVGALSLAMLVKTLADPAFISYLPYQSYWVEQLSTGAAQSDGEERFYRAIEASQQRNARQ